MLQQLSEYIGVTVTEQSNGAGEYLGGHGSASWLWARALNRWP